MRYVEEETMQGSSDKVKMPSKKKRCNEAAAATYRRALGDGWGISQLSVDDVSPACDA
jgi:hypothetical protein